MASEESLGTEAGMPSGPDDWFVLGLDSSSSHSSARTVENWNI